MGKNKQSAFAILISAILLVDCASAGLLDSIRQEAAFLKEAIQDSLESIDPTPPRDSRALGLGGVGSQFQPNTHQKAEPSLSLFDFSNFLGTSGCPPGDFLCLATRNMKTGPQNEMSNAIVKSVASLMTEMLNGTISRSIMDMMIHSQHSNDPKEQAEARQAMSMATGALSMVSSKVIQAFAYFVKVSISGVMWDLFHQMVNAAKRSAFDGARGLPQPQQQQQVQQSVGVQQQQQPIQKQEGLLNYGVSAEGVNPSNFNGNLNTLKRVSQQ